MDLQGKIFPAIKWTAVSQFGSMFIQLVIMLVLARHVAEEAFGLLALTNVICAFLLIFANKGFDDAIIQRNELDERTKSTAFWTSIGAGIVLTVVGCMVSPLAAFFFEEPRLVPVLCVLSLSMFFGASAAVPQALLRRELNLKPLALRELFGRAIGGAVGVTMAVMDYGVWSLVANQIIGEAASTAILWITAGYKPKRQFSPSEAKQLLSFGLNIIGAQVMNFLNHRFDIIIIGKFFGLDVLGFYAIAMRIIDMSVSVFMGLYARVGYPVMCRLAQDIDLYRMRSVQVLQVLIVLAVPFALSLTYFADSYILLLFGPNWQGAVDLLSLLAPLLIFKIPSWAQALGLIALGMPRQRFYLAVVFAMITVSSLSIAGYAGLDWFTLAASVRYVLMGLITLFVFCHYSGISRNKILRYFVMSLLVGFFCYFTANEAAVLLHVNSHLYRIGFLAIASLVYLLLIGLCLRAEVKALILLVRTNTLSRESVGT